MVESSRWRHRFAAAIRFLTRLQTPGRGCTAECHRECLRRSVVYFPAVGGSIGTLTATVLVAGLVIGLSPWVATLLALAAEAMLTGAFHEDALADSCDALGGDWRRVRVLEIMKDSRLGTYGTIGLVIGIGMRSATIVSCVSVSWLWAAVAIIASASMGRIAIVGLMACTPPIDISQSLAKDVSGGQSWRTVWAAAAISTPFWFLLLLLHPFYAFAGIVSAILVVAWFRRKIMWRVGGTTGDLLGCSAYLVQLVIMLGASAVK